MSAPGGGRSGWQGPGKSPSRSPSVASGPGPFVPLCAPRGGGRFPLEAGPHPVPTSRRAWGVGDRRGLEGGPPPPGQADDGYRTGSWGPRVGGGGHGRSNPSFHGLWAVSAVTSAVPTATPGPEAEVLGRQRGKQSQEVGVGVDVRQNPESPGPFACVLPPAHSLPASWTCGSCGTTAPLQPGLGTGTPLPTRPPACLSPEGTGEVL